MRGNKKHTGGCLGFDMSNHVTVDSYDVNLGSYGGNMRCAREGCFFKNVKMNQFKRAPQG